MPATGDRLPEVARTLAATRVPLARARHVPGEIYHSPAIFRLEKERLFMRDWLCVGRVEELAEPGAYRTERLFDEPVLLVRDRDGSIKAFSNVCAHRGVEVATGEGHAGEFRCPHHGWRYDLAGRLLAAPGCADTAGFDPRACGLRPIRTGEWSGWIFLTFDDEAPSLATHLADYAKDFAFLRQEDCRLAGKIVAEFDCNWKLIVENLMDFYHVETIHKASFAGPEYRFDTEGRLFELRPGGGFSAFYDAAPMVFGKQSLFGRMPWLDERHDLLGCIGFLQPNLNLLARSDYVRPYVTWPLSPTRTRAVAYFLFPERCFADPDFAAKVERYKDFVRLVVDEDIALVKSLQQASAARTFRPGPMSILEAAIHHVLNNYLERMFGDRERQAAE